MAGKKLKTILIKLVSSAGTGYFYPARKNPTTTQHKVAFMKYDPIIRQHVLFNESKMPKSRGGRRAGK
jgi:large subunit ribosomal protein L33